jgi:hypothetical protein
VGCVRRARSRSSPAISAARKHRGRRCRKRPIRHDRARHRDRWRIEAAICRLKDFRPVGTRCDKLAANFASAVALAAVVAFWC